MSHKHDFMFHGSLITFEDRNDHVGVYRVYHKQWKSRLCSCGLTQVFHNRRWLNEATMIKNGVFQK